MMKILFIDTGEHIENSLKTILADEYSVASYTSPEEGGDGCGADLVKEENPDIIVLDVTAANSSGIHLIRGLTSTPDSPPIIITSRWADIRQVVQAMRLGVYDYITGPIKVEQLTGTIRKALDYKVRRSRKLPNKKAGFLENLIGESPLFTEVKNLLKAYADADSPILLTGESGTGKDLAAKVIHNLSLRREGPFIPINCGAIPETLMESELFGSVKGAFTDARDREGCFEQASGGTLLLDEIGEMRLPAQVKLLRVLEEKRVTRVGETKQRPIDVRIISATNRDLKKAVNRKDFRRDLYYRISILPLYIPPLRDRKEDIPLLSAYFLENSINGKRYLAQGAEEKLMAYPWPGNVRELKNVLERAAILAEKRQIGEQYILFQ